MTETRMTLLQDAAQTARYLRRLADEIDGSELTLHWRQDVAFLRLLASQVEAGQTPPPRPDMWDNLPL